MDERQRRLYAAADQVAERFMHRFRTPASTIDPQLDTLIRDGLAIMFAVGAAFEAGHSVDGLLRAIDASNTAMDSILSKRMPRA